MRPSWINEVKEIDRDEAKVLVAIGLPCWYDCCWVDRDVSFEDAPFIHEAESCNENSHWDAFFYYTTLGESLER